jgi:DNA-binding response OmpR family regulator
VLKVVKVLLIEDNRIEARQTQHRLATSTDGTFEVEWVDRLDLGIERLGRGGIDIVLLDLNLPDSQGLETLVNLHARYPDVPIVVLTGEYEEEIGALSLEQGAQDYQVKQQLDVALLARVLRYLGIASQRAHLKNVGKLQRNTSARVLGCVGAKGGVGTTTTALNVAVALAMQHKSVILAELQPSFGPLSCLLQHEPAASLGTLLQLPAARIGEQELVKTLWTGPEQSRILFGPRPQEAFQEIEPDQAIAIVSGFAKLADFLVLDLPSRSPATQAVLRLCHGVAVVTECEPASVRCGAAMIDQIVGWGVPRDLVTAIIVNRTVLPISMGAAEIRSRLDCELMGIVPGAALELLHAFECGMALVHAQPSAAASASFIEIANRFSAGAVVGMNTVQPPVPAVS